MYWQQKGQLLGSTQARTDQLQTIITNYLSGKSTRYMRVDQVTDIGAARPSLMVLVQYDAKADADQVWSDIQTAHTSGWIVPPSFVSYGQQPENAGESFALLGRIDW